VPAAYQGRLHPGLPVTASLPHAPGVRYVGNLRTIQPAASAQTGTVTAEVWLPNHGRRLRAGLAVNAEIRLREGAAVPAVPIASVFAQEGEQYVYRLEEDGKIHQTQVTLGAERGNSAPVLEGLRPGDRILRDGRRSVADESRFAGVAGEKPEEPAAAEGSKRE
jgi:multidrug efflux system membrane fusion protein